MLSKGRGEFSSNTVPSAPLPRRVQQKLDSFFCAQTTLVVFCRDLPAEAVYPEIISIFVYAKTGDIIIGPVPCTGLGN